jgi:hypothetical protein
MSEEYIAQRAAALYLGFSVAHFRRHIHEHVVSYVGRSPRYKKADLDRYMAEQKEKKLRPPPQKRRRKRATVSFARRTTPSAAKLARELER